MPPSPVEQQTLGGPGLLGLPGHQERVVMCMQKALEAVVPSGHGDARLPRWQTIPIKGGQRGGLQRVTMAQPTV